MTAPARITQADIERTAKAVKLAGFERVRFIMDFVNQRIEVIIGESDDTPAPEPSEEWPDDD